MSIPKFTRALILKESSIQKKPVYNDAVLEKKPIPTLKPGQVLVKIGAAAYNHRDVWIRKAQYPGIVIGSIFGSDGAGVVIASGNSSDQLMNQRVFLTPMRGWEKDPIAPESRFGIVGGGALPPIGTFSEYVVVERDQVIPSPSHLNDVQIAAWPLGGLTAWRATIVNAQVDAGQHVLITGIGGGVALLAMQICIAKGALVYVTSSSQEKIDKAITLGAKGGTNYKQKDWPVHMGRLLNGSSLDSVIDSGGGDILGQTSKYLKQGGKVVCYGMTAGSKVTLTMREVMRNQQLIGSTMGSHKDLIEATNFLAEHRIVPVVSHVLDGLEAAEEGFELMKRGDQFGKIVIKVKHSDDTIQSKL
ncbi:hypothetical protein BDQ12DRAFT_706376 [Crucibulum laeve]|uniref:Enoyl reductase (ER) domain-containing protein n=1 Tax=Crucibulum laeve TaxID=68775 RepID=A0A5C3LU21_9AGAR|nr:hypothetical protein BDQ12DRAFT_706376 [Crucibulum laeve]